MNNTDSALLEATVAYFVQNLGVTPENAGSASETIARAFLENYSAMVAHLDTIKGE